MAKLGVGIIGTGYMGEMHSAAIRSAQTKCRSASRVRLIAICGRDADRTVALARRFGYVRATTEWESVVSDPNVDIVAILVPNALHAPIALACAASRKHIVCEKPLSISARESEEMLRAADASGVVHVCGFNYRLFPAVALARDLVQRGALGDLVHFRARYLQDWRSSAPDNDWHLDPERAGTGSIGDYSHIIDLAVHFGGELASVSALTTSVPSPAGPETHRQHSRHTDDAYCAIGRFPAGASLALEASRVASGNRATIDFELNGTLGSVSWSLDSLNRLHVSPATARDHDLRSVDVTARDHPFMHWWAGEGAPLGFDASFVHEWCEVFDAIDAGRAPTNGCATFYDGLQADRVADAIARSAAAPGALVELGTATGAD
jgi:predicted dehydrogenase